MARTRSRNHYIAESLERRLMLSAPDLAWSSYLGGGFDTSYNGGGDAFVAKINADGTLAWSSYLGGAGDAADSDVG